ncbi:uncharacterized protein Z520_09613 [Fonsecaea multimorphosa CBS 102226]|uniref:DUF1754-domain-containing protein n=1 Tax=Fonsecaea multimorphosa CBS 102226 TaxID=1442371 RepID=A0A0D2JMN3_9EURO|nr:uncharacterized protein Z520_09613 [Fonsecaea multimorphosa CBS 102226]KIX94567.1 hypothetical protein Z520_09613 [Fonsecaea multimorphosa CBS 102226]OAL20277.1 hypothetical protein AYO22_08989 [Fonsecaea multimorphosa]
MAPSDYISAGSGKLKLKGVKDSKVDKKKKSKKSSSSKAGSGQNEQPSNTPDPTAEGGDRAGAEDQFKDRSVMLRKLEEEDQMISNEARESGVRKRKKADSPGSNGDDDAAARPNEEEQGGIVKTEAERRYEEQRRRRLEERLKREGVKTHKERVEELNRYLSSLSEHHDMPRIGPG